MKGRSAANMHVELPQSFLTPRGKNGCGGMELIYTLACFKLPSIVPMFCCNPRRPIFLARRKKNFDHHRLDMSLGLV
jgi:hypothetical protein